MTISNMTSWTLKKNLERRSRNRQCNNTIIIIIIFVNRLRATRTDGRPRSVTFSGWTGAFHQQRSSCTCGVDSYLPNTTRSYRANNHCVTQHETRDRRTRRRRVRHTTPPAVRDIETLGIVVVSCYCRPLQQYSSSPPAPLLFSRVPRFHELRRHRAALRCVRARVPFLCAHARSTFLRRR